MTATSRLSPRTAARPMAFTAGEFIKGAFATFGIFVAGVIPVTAIVFLLSGAVEYWYLGAAFAPFYAGLIGGASLLVIGWPLALSAAILMRGSDRLVVHVVVHGVVGMFVGLLTIAASDVAMMLAADPSQLRVPSLDDVLFVVPSVAWVLPYIVLTGVSAALGWMTTAMPAIRRDRIGGVGAFAAQASAPAPSDYSPRGTSSIRSESAGSGRA